MGLKAPSQRQIKTLANLKDCQSYKEAMIKAGYSPKTAEAPTLNLLGRDSWKALVEKYVPDKKLIKVLDEGLNASKEIVIGDNLTSIKSPDYAVRHKYLETGLKIKNKFPKESPITAIQVNIKEDLESYAI